MRRVHLPLRWSWDAFFAGMLVMSVALLLLPNGPWLLPLDLIAIGFLVAGAIRSAQVLLFVKRLS